jgi:hypothetical protein
MRAVGGAIACAALVAACRHGDIDRSAGFGGSPTTANIEDVPVKGFPVAVATANGTVSGELLAVGETEIHVLEDRGTRSIAIADVRSVSVELYPSRGGAMVLWTALGTVSTLSHGLLLIFSAPTWVVVGATTAGVSGLNNDIDIPRDKLPKLWQFARFPAGLPATWSTAAATRNP